MNFSNRIKELRKHYEYTQKEMGEKLGIATITYFKYEHGENEPNYNTLIKLSNIFNVSIDYLLGKDNERDIQVYNFNKAKENFEKSLSILIKDFPEYKEGIMNLAIEFIRNTRAIDMLYRLDLLYIKNDISKEIDHIYEKFYDIYEEKYCKNHDISTQLSTLISESSKFRKKVDDYLTLITSEDYFTITTDIEKMNEPYFKNEIIGYK